MYKKGKFSNRFFIVTAVALILIVGVVAQNLTNDSDSTTSPSRDLAQNVEATSQNRSPPPEEGTTSNGETNNGTATANSDEIMNADNYVKEKVKKDFIKDFVEKEDISEKDIKSIEQIDLANPPEEVKLGKEIEDTNVAIFQVDYEKQNESKKLFVVTYSGEEFKVPLKLKPATAIEYLNFGEAERVDGSAYLKTATNVKTSEKNGYVMMDYGSITGLSTSLEVLESSGGVIEIIVYINGEDVGLRNTIYSPELGTNKDYDKESKDVIKFEPGDIISVYVKVNGKMVWTNVINLVKIQIEE